MKKQAVDLAANFDRPASFVRGLHALLDRYTDHTHRSGQSGEPFPLSGAYNTSPPVMRQVWVELTHQTRLHSECILPLCDALWADPNYDLQLLAARLLGQLPTDPPEPVIERLRAWVTDGIDRRLLDGLLEHSLEQFQHKSPDVVLALVSSWLESSDTNLRLAGLRLLLAMIESPASEKLPSIFKLLTPYLRIAPPRLRPDILAVLTSLVRTSPAETAYLLRQCLNASDNPDTAWLIRQVLDEFPEDLRMGLRASMKAQVGESHN